MSDPRLTRAFARNAAESAYPNLWRGLVAAWAPSGAPRHATRLWDYSGNGNHGTLRNGATWTPGKDGYAVSFDGNDDDVIGDTPGKNFPVGNQSRTVACWVKAGSWSGDLGLLHWGNNGASPDASNYQLVAGTGGKILWGNGYGFGIVDGNTNIDDNKWHHVAGTYGNGLGIIYIDGKIDASKTHTPATILTHPWRWGRFQNDLGAWPGQFNNCLLYGRQLDAHEIAQLYIGLSPFSRPSTNGRARHKRRSNSFATFAI